MTQLTAEFPGKRSRGRFYLLAILATTSIVFVVSLAWAYRGTAPEATTANDLVKVSAPVLAQVAVPSGLAVLLPDANRQVAVVLSDPERETLHIHIPNIQLSGDRQLVLWEMAANDQPSLLGAVSDGTVLSFPSSGLIEGARLIVTLEEDGSDIPDLPRGPILVAGTLKTVN